MVGEFGSRNAQYEKFYGGASFLVKQKVLSQFRLQAGDGAGRWGIELAAG